MRVMGFLSEEGEIHYTYFHIKIVILNGLINIFWGKKVKSCKIYQYTTQKQARPFVFVFEAYLSYKS